MNEELVLNMIQMRVSLAIGKLMQQIGEEHDNVPAHLLFEGEKRAIAHVLAYMQVTEFGEEPTHPVVNERMEALLAGGSFKVPSPSTN